MCLRIFIQNILLGWRSHWVSLWLIQEIRIWIALRNDLKACFFLISTILNALNNIVMKHLWNIWIKISRILELFCFWLFFLQRNYQDVKSGSGVVFVIFSLADRINLPNPESFHKRFEGRTTAMWQWCLFRAHLRDGEPPLSSKAWISQQAGFGNLPLGTNVTGVTVQRFSCPFPFWLSQGCSVELILRITGIKANWTSACPS